MVSAGATKVLVVDDSPITLEVVYDVLAAYGFVVETTSEPCECTNLLVEFQPDVLVLDIAMPVLDGISLLRMIQRNRTHNCLVLLFSDRDRAELVATIRACGADGGAVKTPDCGELVSVLNSVLLSRSRTAVTLESPRSDHR
jgi:DNA-binding response OmpR family regulator